jgi:hypothetical protein
MLAGPAVQADGSLKDASEIEWSHSCSPSPALPNESCACAPLHKPISTPNEEVSPTVQGTSAPSNSAHTLHPPIKRKAPPTAAITKPTKTRHDIFWTDKVKILDWMKEKRASQSETARYWQSHSFPNLSQGVISRWVKDERKIREHALDPKESGFKRARLVENPKVEALLWLWCLSRLQRKHKFTGQLIIEKAWTFETMHNPGILDKDRMSFSSGWLEKFKRQMGLKEYKSHGEAGSVSNSSVDEEVKRLRLITDKFHPSNILNFDEAGLNFWNPPDKGLAMEPSSGIKGDKTRLTFGFATNADGTWKSDQPLIIGWAKNPHCFKKRSAKALRFEQYY